MKNAIGMAQLSAEQIEANTRVRDGRVEVFCFGGWVDVEKEREAAEAAMAGGATQ